MYYIKFICSQKTFLYFKVCLNLFLILYSQKFEKKLLTSKYNCLEDLMYTFKKNYPPIEIINHWKNNSVEKTFPLFKKKKFLFQAQRVTFQRKSIISVLANSSHFDANFFSLFT